MFNFLKKFEHKHRKKLNIAFLFVLTAIWAAHPLLPSVFPNQELATAISFAIIFIYLALIVDYLRNLTDKPYRVFSQQGEANRFLINEFINTSSIVHKAQMIQYSSDQVKDVIYALLDKNVKVELLIQHPDNAIDEYQKNKINGQLETFRNVYKGRSNINRLLDIRLYKDKATVRAIKIDDKAIIMGSYTYFDSCIQGHNNPALLFTLSHTGAQPIAVTFDVLFAKLRRNSDKADIFTRRAVKEIGKGEKENE